MSRQYGIDVKNIRLSYRSDVTNLRNEMYNPRTDLPNRKQLVLIAFFEVEIEDRNQSIWDYSYKRESECR
jgi:hypothetical protein